MGPASPWYISELYGATVAHHTNLQCSFMFFRELQREVMGAWILNHPVLRV